jgi:hypothetical protein
MYFSMVTMITLGYGDVVPISEEEKIYTIFISMIACGFFSYVLGSV